MSEKSSAVEYQASVPSGAFWYSCDECQNDWSMTEKPDGRDCPACGGHISGPMTLDQLDLFVEYGEYPPQTPKECAFCGRHMGVNTGQEVGFCQGCWDKGLRPQTTKHVVAEGHHDVAPLVNTVLLEKQKRRS